MDHTEDYSEQGKLLKHYIAMFEAVAEKYRDNKNKLAKFVDDVEALAEEAIFIE